MAVEETEVLSDLCFIVRPVLRVPTLKSLRRRATRRVVKRREASTRSDAIIADIATKELDVGIRRTQSTL
jgi:hypothetical protein